MTDEVSQTSQLSQGLTRISENGATGDSADNDGDDDVIGDPEIDKSVARSAAMRLATFLEAEMAAGIDAATLASAAIACGSDLMAKVLGSDCAAKSLRLVADDLQTITSSDSRQMMN